MRTKWDIKRAARRAVGTICQAVFAGLCLAVTEYVLFSFVRPQARTAWSFYLGSPDLVYGVRGPWQLLAHKALAFSWVTTFVVACFLIIYTPLYPLYKRLGIGLRRAAIASAVAALLTIEFFVLLGYYVEPPGKLAPFILFGFPGGVFVLGVGGYLLGQWLPLARLTATTYFKVATVLLLGTATVLSYLPSRRSGEAVVGPNLIYITIDALRADKVGPGPDGVSLTPNIDAFAAEATVFTRCAAPAPWTLPSFATVFAGVPPHVHRAGKQYPLGSQYETLAELFARKGYDTAAVVANGFCEPRFGLAQGFDYYRSMEMLEGTVISRLYYTRLLGPFFTRKHLYFDTTPVVERRSVEYLLSRRRNQRPFFLWVHFLDPHEPYTPPVDYMPEEVKDYAPHFNLDQPTPKNKWAAQVLYDAEVRYVDDAVGRVLAAAKEAGVYDNAVIIISADHGEEFWEHGCQGHGKNLYETVLHIPFIARAPGIWKPGSKTDVPISSADLFGTLEEMFALSPQCPHDSGSFVHCYGDPRLIPACRYSSQPMGGDEASVALYYGNNKYIRYPSYGGYELFDLTTDPGETTPQKNAFVAAGYDKIIARWNAEGKRLSETYGTVEASDEMMLQQLRGLGYIK